MSNKDSEEGGGRQVAEDWIAPIDPTTMARELTRALFDETVARGGEQHLAQSARVALQRAISAGLLVDDVNFPDLRQRVENRALHDAHLHAALSRHRQGELTWTEAMEAAALALSDEAGRLRGELLRKLGKEGSEP